MENPISNPDPLHVKEDLFLGVKRILMAACFSVVGQHWFSCSSQSLLAGRPCSQRRSQRPPTAAPPTLLQHALSASTRSALYQRGLYSSGDRPIGGLRGDGGVTTLSVHAAYRRRFPSVPTVKYNPGMERQHIGSDKIIMWLDRGAPSATRWWYSNQWGAWSSYPEWGAAQSVTTGHCTRVTHGDTWKERLLGRRGTDGSKPGETLFVCEWELGSSWWASMVSFFQEPFETTIECSVNCPTWKWEGESVAHLSLTLTIRSWIIVISFISLYMKYYYRMMPVASAIFIVR